MNVPLTINVLISISQSVAPDHPLMHVLDVLVIPIVHQASLSVPYITMSALLMVSTLTEVMRQ